MKVKKEEIELDPTIHDEIEEELWDNVFLQVQFIHPRGFNVDNS